MKLYADSREPPGLLEMLNARSDKITTGNLDIGDFIIKNDNDEILMIFERKTLSDLISSIKDGRYKEQSFRLSQLPLNNHHIYYIIEGNIFDYTSKHNPTTIKMLYSSMFSLSYTKGFSLLHANSWLDTGEYLLRFMDKLPENTKPNNSIKLHDDRQSSLVESKETTPLPTYTSSIKCTKKSNITTDNIGEIMLAQIPGVSMHAAQSLMIEYKTIKNLMDLLVKDKNCLDNFLIPSKNGKRKINKTTINALTNYLQL